MNAKSNRVAITRHCHRTHRFFEVTGASLHQHSVSFGVGHTIPIKDVNCLQLGIHAVQLRSKDCAFSIRCNGHDEARLVYQIDFIQQRGSREIFKRIYLNGIIIGATRTFDADSQNATIAGEMMSSRTRH